jgi:hypothetical protein
MVSGTCRKASGESETCLLKRWALIWIYVALSYANMDYILTSALAGFDLMELTLSYDIACQWRKNFAE